MAKPDARSSDWGETTAFIGATPGPCKVRLLNPVAGVKAGVSTTRGTTPEALRDLMVRYHLGDELIVTASADEASAAARDAVQQGYDLVIAAGGDGTVATVASELLDSETALGILPLGSVMNVARMLDLPREPEAAAAVIANGTPRVIDVGEANGQLFLEGGSIGLNAAIFREFQYLDAGQYRSLLTALWVLLRYRPARMVLHLDDQIVATRALMVAVANAPTPGSASPSVPMPGSTMADSTSGSSSGFPADSCLLTWARSPLAGVAIRRRSRPTARSGSTSRASTPLPCRADAHDLGTTPVTFVVRHAALKVIGPGVKADGMGKR